MINRVFRLTGTQPSCRSLAGADPSCRLLTGPDPSAPSDPPRPPHAPSSSTGPPEHRCRSGLSSFARRACPPVRPPVTSIARRMPLLVYHMCSISIGSSHVPLSFLECAFVPRSLGDPNTHSLFLLWSLCRMASSSFLVRHCLCRTPSRTCASFWPLMAIRMSHDPLLAYPSPAFLRNHNRPIRVQPLSALASLAPEPLFPHRQFPFLAATILLTRSHVAMSARTAGVSRSM